MKASYVFKSFAALAAFQAAAYLTPAVRAPARGPDISVDFSTDEADDDESLREIEGDSSTRVWTQPRAARFHERKSS